MSDKIWVAPNGSRIIGTLDLVPGVALLSDIDPETGEPDYDGETEMDWDGQKTVQRGGKDIFVDDNGDEWTFDQLKQVEEEEADA